MGDQFGDAEREGRNPHDEVRRQREAATNASEATAAAELATVEQWTDRLAAELADSEMGPGTWRDFTADDADSLADSYAAGYRQTAVTALTVLAPEIARRDQLIAQLRAHLIEQADKLAGQPDRTMTAPSVAEVLRAIVEATR